MQGLMHQWSAYYDTLQPWFQYIGSVADMVLSTPRPTLPPLPPEMPTTSPTPAPTPAPTRPPTPKPSPSGKQLDDVEAGFCLGYKAANPDASAQEVGHFSTADYLRILQGDIEDSVSAVWTNGNLPLYSRQEGLCALRAQNPFSRDVKNASRDLPDLRARW